MSRKFSYPEFLGWRTVPMVLTRNLMVAWACLLAVAAQLVALPSAIGAEEPFLPRLEDMGGRMLEYPVIPADFSLVNQRNESFRSADLQGKWTILFLGYTHCSDVCPTTLQVLNGVVNELTTEARPTSEVQVVFVSVDPHRDTVPVLKEHMDFFNPKFLGVTGQPAEVRRFTESLGARYDYRERDKRKKLPDVLHMPEQVDYYVGHTADLFLFDPRGRNVAYIFPPPEVERVVDIFKLVRSYFEAHAANIQPAVSEPRVEEPDRKR